MRNNKRSLNVTQVGVSYLSIECAWTSLVVQNIAKRTKAMCSGELKIIACMDSRRSPFEAA